MADRKELLPELVSLIMTRTPYDTLFTLPTLSRTWRTTCTGGPFGFWLAYLGGDNQPRYNKLFLAAAKRGLTDIAIILLKLGHERCFGLIIERLIVRTALCKTSWYGYNQTYSAILDFMVGLGWSVGTLKQGYLMRKKLGVVTIADHRKSDIGALCSAITLLGWRVDPAGRGALVIYGSQDRHDEGIDKCLLLESTRKNGWNDTDYIFNDRPAPGVSLRLTEMLRPYRCGRKAIDVAITDQVVGLLNRNCIGYDDADEALNKVFTLLEIEQIYLRVDGRYDKREHDGIDNLVWNAIDTGNVRMLRAMEPSGKCVNLLLTASKHPEVTRYLLEAVIGPNSISGSDADWGLLTPELLLGAP